MTEDMGYDPNLSTSENRRISNAGTLIRALQTSGALTLQQEAQLQVAFQKAGDAPPEQTFLESGIFTPKQAAGLAKTMILLESRRISINHVASCLSTMLGTFGTLDEALTEIECAAAPEGQISPEFA